ncbi:MAG: protein phosphatase CheZ [Syntrophobacteraceae bacterium]|nr:protein phosphatase CheZ [Syntrophobacteraceae bacterium]
MIELDTQDLDELVKLLMEAEESVTALSGADSEKELEKSRRALVSFHTTAAMLGMDGLGKVGVELETFLSGSVAPGFSMDSVASLGFAISTVIDGVKAIREGKGEIDLDEIQELLRPPADPSGSTGEGVSSSAREAAGLCQAVPELEGRHGMECDLERLSDIVRNLGGELTIDSDGYSGGTFQLSFTGSTDTLRKIEKFFRAGERLTSGSYRTIEESMVETVKTNVNEFIEAFSSADMASAQNILLKLADQPRADTGLYKEIGSMARGLHDSIGSFLNTLDPSLQEIVEDKIPDSGSRLEHILAMTEKAALTTMDHVENVQDRITKEMNHISKLREILGGLTALGEPAGKKLDESLKTLDAMEEIIKGHRSDLDIILSAQDYQDLSGQIIHKITKLLNDIEDKLISLIRTFGVRLESPGQKKVDELYGPAHAAMENAVHSQDEVDSLLSDFGF